MYSLFTTTAPGAVSQGSVTYGKGLSDMMDKFLVLRRNAKDLAPGTEVVLSDAQGRTLRKFATALETVAPALKLTEAMRKALVAGDSGLTGVPGKANTLKALESRGLVKIQNDGVARLTSLGRQYQKKGA